MKNRTLLTVFAAIALLAMTPIFTLSQNNRTPKALTSFSAFSLPQNIGTTVNSGDSQNAVAIAPSGLSLYFSSNRGGGQGSLDIWVSQRPTLTAAWGTPQNLGLVINTASNENLPTLSPDGKTMFFNCSCPDAIGGADIYMTTRTDPNNDFGWTAPVNLGTVINTVDVEWAAGYFENTTNGTAVLYFGSDRADGLGDFDIYQSTRNANGTFNPPTNVAELNSTSLDSQLQVRHDGLEIFFVSERGRDRDIYVSTRGSVSAPWNPPVNLASVNSSGSDQAPSLSPDGSVLYFVSGRDGLVDIYTATRVSVNRAPASDFNGDGRADVSVFRPSSGTWWVLNSGDNTVSARQFGSNGDRVVPGDYDGDSRTDLAIFRPSTGIWWISRSSDNSVAAINWGISTDRPVPDDYDGDGRTDVAVYRDGTWYILQSSNGSVSYQQFGLSTDIPISAGVQ